MKKQRWTIGAIVEIQIPQDLFCYGVLKEFPYISFLNKFSRDKCSLADLLKTEILFTLCVESYPVTSGIWKKIGKIDHNKFDMTVPPQFSEDAISGDISIWHPSFEPDYFVPASYDDVVGMERYSVWSDNHVVDRLKASSEGKIDKWTASSLLRERH